MRPVARIIIVAIIITTITITTITKLSKTADGGPSTRRQSFQSRKFCTAYIRTLEKQPSRGTATKS